MNNYASCLQHLDVGDEISYYLVGFGTKTYHYITIRSTEITDSFVYVTSELVNIRLPLAPCRIYDADVLKIKKKR